MGFIDWKKDKINQYEEVKEYAQTAERMEEEVSGSRKNRRRAAEFFGTMEFLDLENNTVLKMISSRVERLTKCYLRTTQNVPASLEIDAKQLYADLLLYTIVDTFKQGNGIPEQKIEVASKRLLYLFKIETKTLVSDYLMFIKSNDKYKRYINNVFCLEENDTSAFWLWMAYLSMCDETGQINRANSQQAEIINFIKEYDLFVRDFSYYVNQLAPGRGCGVKNRTIVLEKISDIRQRMYEDIDIQKYIPVLKNPLYFEDEEDLDIRNMINDEIEIVRNRELSSQARVKAIIKLIDTTSEGEVQVLNNYYEHMISTI